MEQLTQLLAQLAEKLGTTTEYLWEVLIRQAYVNSMINIFAIIFTVLLGVALWKVHKWGCEKPKEGYCDTNYEKHEILIMLPMIIFGFVFAICFFVSTINFGSTLSGLINPEYWALKQVLSIIN